MSSPETESQNRERDIFLQALECSTPEERSKFLDEACANNPSLRAAVEVLLQNHKEDGFLETPPVVAQSPGEAMDDRRKTILIEIVGERPGDTIGRYKLLQQIGEGGVGVVFMAEQESPVRRRVAVKVLKPGLDTKSVITRFESERQALALMDHPHIAKVFDAGSTAAGRPYFVMELVRGVRITEYCDQNRLPTRERAALFIQVCQAIQHAHQKGIIHRDIKPSNILVTLHDGVPMPKVIDFGIAKAIDQRLTDKTLFTEFQCFIGTPAYISPEQAEMSGLDIDTRADIYSLGVLLYELLTGKTPFDAQELWSSGLDGMRRTIREQEPTRPSTRLATMSEAERTTTAQRQQVEPAKLTSLLRGDLDWIVLKALEKDRTRRYATANDLAQDIRRYLDHEPVLARPPTATYRFQKLVRRNKLLFAGVGAFTAALVIGLAFSTWQFIEKNAAYRRMVNAEQEQSRLRREAEAARQSAEIQALAARGDAYAADMNLAQQALAANNLGRAQELLSRHRPLAKPHSEQGSETAAVLDSPVATDLRGWEWRYLWQQCQSDALFTLCQLSNEVHALSVSHDGRWAAIGQNGVNEVLVWDLRARQEITRFTPGGNQQPFAFSPHAPLLAVSSKEERLNLDDRASASSRVRLWDVGTRKMVRDFEVSGFCNAMAFSPDGARLLTASSDGKVIIWSVAEGAVLASYTVSKPELTGGVPPSAFAGQIAFNRDLNLVAQAMGGGQIRVTELASNRELWTAQAADENVTVLAFSPDGTRLASGAGFVESAVRLWDVASGRELARLVGHRTYVRALVFWPDGEKLASASGDQTIHLWDLTSLEALASPATPSGSAANRPESGPQRRWRRTRIPELNPHATLRGHRLEVWSLALSPDNSTLVSGSKDGSVFVWDTETVQSERGYLTLPVEVRAWSFGPDSQTILAFDEKGRVARWQGGEFQQTHRLVETGTNSMNARFSADGRFIAAVSPEGVTGVWDLLEGRFRLEVGSKEVRNLPVAFLPRSNHLVTYQPREGVFQEWDVTTGRELRSWRFTAPGPRGANGFSADEQWFVALNGEGTGELRNLASGQRTRFDLNLKGVANAAFSPEGRLLAVVSNLGMGQIWEMARMQKVATLEGFLQGAHSASFSPDGQRLAIGSNGNEAVKLWDVKGFQELVTLKGQGSLFDSVAFSPDSNLLASKNRRGILHIWRAPSFEAIARQEAQGR